MSPQALAQRERIAQNELAEQGVDAAALIHLIDCESVAQLREIYTKGYISLGASYSKAMLGFLGTTLEKRLDLLLGIIPWILAAISGYWTITHGQWGYGIVALMLIAVKAVTKRYQKIGDAISGLGFMAGLGAAFAGAWPVVIILAAIVTCAICMRLRTGLYSEFIVERALQSDIIFGFLFFAHRIHVRNNLTGLVIEYRNLDPSETALNT
jgi:hypothetical protein